MAAVRQKSLALSSLCIELLQGLNSEYGFTLVSPPDASARGSQVCIAHEEGYGIVQVSC